MAGVFGGGFGEPRLGGFEGWIVPGGLGDEGIPEPGPMERELMKEVDPADFTLELLEKAYAERAPEA